MKEENNTEKKEKYTSKIIFIVALFAFLIFYLIKHEGVENIKNLLINANYKWVLCGLVCLVLMWVMESITIHIPLKKLYPKHKYFTSFEVTMVGQLFNNITPFASGGQIMQAYVLNKKGVRTSDALSVLMARFIIVQTVMIVFTIGVVISQFAFFAQVLNKYLFLGIIGVLINIAVVVMFYLIGTHKAFVMKISKPLINFFSKIHIGKHHLIKNPEEKLEKFEKSVENFNYQFNLMKAQKKTVLLIAFLGLIQSILYYLITYSVYRTFGNSGVGLLKIITIQAFLMLIMTITPTPGSGLGAEGGFLLLFKTIFNPETINLSILFWRIYVFYLPIIVGAIFMLFINKRYKDSDGKTIGNKDKEEDGPIKNIDAKEEIKY